MAPLPPPGTSAPADTGNALTNPGAAPPPGTKYAVTGPSGAQQSAAINAALNAVNTANAQSASDCLWPPSGKISVPIIPGVYTQSFNLPCLISYSEARAVAAVFLIGTGIAIMAFGINIIAFAEVGLPAAAAVLATNPETAPAAATAKTVAKPQTPARTKGQMTTAS